MSKTIFVISSIMMLCIVMMSDIVTYAQPIENYTNVITELRDIKEELKDKTVQNVQTIFAILTIPASVLGGLLLYRLSESNQRKESKRRSGIAIKKELLEIKSGLEGNKHTRQERKPSKEYLFGSGPEQKKIDQINYVGALFVIDAYESTLYSGLLTHFKPETQHMITELYSRIRDHNETAKYTRKHADNFFLNPEADMEDWEYAVEGYAVALTLWEMEIKTLIDEVFNIDEIKKIDLEKTY